MRLIWLGLGFLALGLGFAGAILPLLPATPFFLVAAYAFARSSPRLHRWLVTHPQFGPPILDWQKHGAIRRSAKGWAMLAIVLTFLVSVLMGLSSGYLAVQAVALLGAATFILTRPIPPPLSPLKAEELSVADNEASKTPGLGRH